MFKIKQSSEVDKQHQERLELSLQHLTESYNKLKTQFAMKEKEANE